MILSFIIDIIDFAAMRVVNIIMIMVNVIMIMFIINNLLLLFFL
jgi:hypothetical protein